MGLGIVNDSEFEKELGRTVPTEIQSEIRDNPDKGRGEGSNQVPDSLRKIIGEESVINGRESALSLAESFGISPSSVSAYANGSTSTKTYDKQPSLEYLNKAKMKIGSRARKVVLRAIERITDEKLDITDAPSLANIAKVMSSVSKDMEPSDPRDGNISGGVGPTFIFYAPQIKEERHYDVINARE